jgi:hypothetical protein
VVWTRRNHNNYRKGEGYYLNFWACISSQFILWEIVFKMSTIEMGSFLLIRKKKYHAFRSSLLEIEEPVKATSTCKDQKEFFFSFMNSNYNSCTPWSWIGGTNDEKYPQSQCPTNYGCEIY